MKRRLFFPMTIGVLLLFSMTVFTVSAESPVQRGVDPDKLNVSYGFGQFHTGYLVTPDPTIHFIVFGGRGGMFVTRGYNLYVSGGGTGGFAVGPVRGGTGYGTFTVGFRDAFGKSSFGYDVSAGVGFGGYGLETLGGGWYLGPTARASFYFGADKNSEIGIFGETLVNVLDIGTTLISVGIIFGGKNGSVSVDWEDRYNLK